jgi:hypothetical protein
LDILQSMVTPFLCHGTAGSMIPRYLFCLFLCTAAPPAVFSINIFINTTVTFIGTSFLKKIADELWQLWFNYWTFQTWYQRKIKMSAISKEKIKMCVLTKIQDIWTEWPDVPIKDVSFQPDLGFLVLFLVTF